MLGWGREKETFDDQIDLILPWESLCCNSDDV